MANVAFKKAVKRYGDVEVIHGIDLELTHGEFVVFVGPSGCGKSTLLRMIAGLEDLSSGSIHIGATDVTHVAAVDRGIAMVFQSYALYPHMTVAQNMGFGLRMNGVNKNVIADKVTVAAKTLQLEDYLDRKPRNLSGGQRQRVAIGRAIVREPEVFLFDEPLSNLDAELRVEMRLQIARLHKDLDATMIYVTHDQVEAMTMADKIVVLKDGHIEQVGSPLELYANPANMFVAGFIGSPKMNLLGAGIESVSDEGCGVRLADGTRLSLPFDGSTLNPQDRVTVGVRPEDLTDSQGECCVKLRVEVAERLGGTTYLYGKMAELDNFVVERGAMDQTRVSEEIDVAMPLDKCHLFNAHGHALPRL